MAGPCFIPPDTTNDENNQKEHSYVGNFQKNIYQRCTARDLFPQGVHARFIDFFSHLVYEIERGLLRYVNNPKELGIRHISASITGPGFFIDNHRKQDDNR